VKLLAGMPVRTLSVLVRGIKCLGSLRHGHMADRAGYSHDQVDLAYRAVVRVGPDQLCPDQLVMATVLVGGGFPGVRLSQLGRR
jgi:hypothetical protein